MSRFNRENIARAVKLGGMTHAEAAESFGCSVPTVKRALRNGNTIGPGKSHRKKNVLAGDHPAVVEGRSYAAEWALRDPGEMPVLKTGTYSGKLGGRITKGWWKGFPIFTLKLEERATCPRSCSNWNNCYGNNMPFAHRFRHGSALEAAICREVKGLAAKHPKGFAVRLHDLGDFYSIGYVNLWLDMIRLYPALHIFGYTARQDFETDQISRAISRAQKAWWPRFAIRWSDGEGLTRNTITIENASAKPPDAIICPAQTHPAIKCASCGLCWTTEKRIAFLHH